ncbi:MAG TPA: hypothetical protein VGK96_04010 [Candidatus Sulfotelmatobacter sp.]
MPTRLLPGMFGIASRKAGVIVSRGGAASAERELDEADGSSLGCTGY